MPFKCVLKHAFYFIFLYVYTSISVFITIFYHNIKIIAMPNR